MALLPASLFKLETAPPARMFSTASLNVLVRTSVATNKLRLHCVVATRTKLAGGLVRNADGNGHYCTVADELSSIELGKPMLGSALKIETALPANAPLKRSAVRSLP